MDKAIAIETARGRPSGIATIKIQTARITILTPLSTVSFEARERSLSIRMRIERNTSWVAITSKVTTNAYF
jgi:hypothetical protein